MSTAIRHQSDYWPEHAKPELQVVSNSSAASSLRQFLFGIRTETRVGSLIAAGGLMMAAKTGPEHLSSLANLSFPPGPLETCAIGLLVWLHAKWRHATRIDA